MGSNTDAVSSLCHLLVLLEEVRRPQDANEAWSVYGSHVSDACNCFVTLFLSCRIDYQSYVVFHNLSGMAYSADGSCVFLHSRCSVFQNTILLLTLWSLWRSRSIFNSQRWWGFSVLALLQLCRYLVTAIVTDRDRWTYLYSAYILKWVFKR